MRRGVIAASGIATLHIDSGFNARTNFNGTAGQMPHVCVLLAHLHGIVDSELGGNSQQQARIARLTTALGVERSLVQHDLPRLTRLQALHLRAITNERHHRASSRSVFVATEIDAAFQLHSIAQVYAELARRTRAVALRFHGCREAGFVDGQTSFTRHVSGEVHREAVGVVQLEHRFARNGGAIQRCDSAFKQGHAIHQRFGEALLLLTQHSGHMVARCTQFRVGLTHDGIEVRH